MSRLVRKRTDANAKPCDDKIKELGGSFVKLDDIGDDVPDRLVGLWGRFNELVEYKDGNKPRSKRKLSDGQSGWHRRWQGRPVTVIFSPEHLEEWALRLRDEP